MNSYSEHIDNISKSLSGAQLVRSLKDILSDRTNGLIMVVGAVALINLRPFRWGQLIFSG